MKRGLRILGLLTVFSALLCMLGAGHADAARKAPAQQKNLILATTTST